MKIQKILFTVALAALLLSGTGCRKHSFGDGTIRFKAVSHSVGTKTAYSGEVFSGVERINWLDGDKIAVAMSNNAGSVVCDYQISTITSSSEISQGQLTNVDASGLQWGEGQHNFVAVYPSPSVDSEWPNVVGTDQLVLKYPAVQTMTPKGDSGADALTLLPDMKYAYMYAELKNVAPESENVTLSFVPLYTAFEISISAGDNDEIHLTGFRLISLADGQYPARVKDFWDDANDYGESESISVDLTGITLTRDGAPLVFTVFAYADSYAHIMLEFTGTEIGTRTLDLVDSGAPIEFEAFCKHRIYGLYFPRLDEGSAGGQGINWNGADGEDLNWNGAEGEDINWGGNKPYVLPGKFSVSATKQVQFARGNLIYKGGEWDFHKQQYDRCLKDNSTVLDISETGTFDLFGWATAGIAGADATMRNYQPWSSSTEVISDQATVNKYGYGPSTVTVPGETSWGGYAEYCDWGYNYALRSKLGNGWHTLSANEWAYMFLDRLNASTVNGVANARFIKATVHGLPGMLAFSDSFGDDYAGDQSIFDASAINNQYVSFSSNVLTDIQWKAVESAGALFLAPTGCYIGMEGVDFILQYEGDWLNFYWTATPYDEENAVVTGSEGNIPNINASGSFMRAGKCAVRLAKTAE